MCLSVISVSSPSLRPVPVVPAPQPSVSSLPSVPDPHPVPSSHLLFLISYLFFLFPNNHMEHKIHFTTSHIYQNYNFRVQRIKMIKNSKHT
jgi:hypothetical protein